MKRSRTISVWLFSIYLSACSNLTTDKPLTHKPTAADSSNKNQGLSSSIIDSAALQKEQLTQIYSRAISEFIKASYQRNKTIYDTLYFGKHIHGQADDFPELDLQSQIENTPIKIITPEEGEKLQKENKTRVYINLFGFLEKENAEFLFVVFSNGFEHQHDYFITFNYSKSLDNIELNKIEFEDYKSVNKQKTKRITIYKDGKYLAD